MKTLYVATLVLAAAATACGHNETTSSAKEVAASVQASPSPIDAKAALVGHYKGKVPTGSADDDVDCTVDIDLSVEGILQREYLNVKVTELYSGPVTLPMQVSVSEMQAALAAVTDDNPVAMVHHKSGVIGFGVEEDMFEVTFDNQNHLKDAIIQTTKYKTGIFDTHNASTLCFNLQRL